MVKQKSAAAAGAVATGPVAAVFFVGSWERPTSQLRGKTGLASLNRFRPTSVGSQQGICTPYQNAAGFSGLGRPVEMQEEKKEEHMDVAEDLYGVASDLYDEDDVETGIRLGASPTAGCRPSCG